ncbi:MAG: hypothetical protein K8F30_08280 [Taibaiella sp.]|nr:hypothetical protein [Taibaiella sp.]
MKVFVVSFLYILSCSLAVVAQEGVVIDFGGSEPSYTPVNFHISEVVDDRPSPNSMGSVKEGEVTVKDGLATALRNYAGNTVPHSASLPVVMHITRLEVTEKAVGAKRQFDLAMSVAYYTGEAKLVEYSGSAFAQSITDAGPYIEKLISDNVSGNLKEFDAWVAKNKNTINAQPTVTVNVSMSGLPENKSHIAYSRNTKLFITDFEGEPDEASPGAAATLSGVGMKIQSSTLRNNTKVDVILTVYFDRSRSWMKDHGKNVTTLQHEQLHFDITAIKACMLKRQIEQTAFTPDNFRQQLKEMLDKVQAETGDIQNTYDRETAHGTIIEAQESWNERISKLLAEQNCYR